MAGHRQRTGKPTRADARHSRMYDQLMAAGSADQQLTIAFDWLRVAVAQVVDTGQRQDLLHSTAMGLAEQAMEISGWRPAGSEAQRQQEMAL